MDTEMYVHYCGLGLPPLVAASLARGCPPPAEVREEAPVVDLPGPEVFEYDLSFGLLCVGQLC